MKKKTVEKVLQLTQECLVRYWQLEPEYALSYCDDDVVWVGSLQSQFMQGKEKVARDFENSLRELKPCHLLEQEYIVAQNTGNACTIVGRYLTTTDDGVEYFLQVQQRCVFVWEQTGDELKIKHINVSNPMGELKVSEGELFVNKLGKMAAKYLMNHIRSLQETKQLAFTDHQDRTRFLLLSDMVYAAAHGRSSLIYTLQGEEIDARMNITDFLSASSGRFVPVHRSYAINPAYVSCIQKYEIVMLDGSRIPVPVRKYKEVREALMRLHDISTTE